MTPTTALAPPIAADRITGRPGVPAATAAAGLGLCLVVNLVDPNEPGSLGLCPFKALTGGLDCPGCGLLRATRAMTRGQLVAAADHNLLWVLLTPLVLWTLVQSWRFERGRRPVRPSTTPFVVVLAITPVWWVLRNTPWAAWFGSGLS